MISIVVAIAENGVIGASGGLPWHLSSDLKRFKRDTMGKPIIMGRKTWESIGRPLPGRLNIVVTGNGNYQAQGAHVVKSLSNAIGFALEHQKNDGRSDIRPADEICIIGGGQLYQEAINLADKLYVTRVKMKPEGDTYFPAIKPDEWEIISREFYPAGEKDDADTEYIVYMRR